MCVAIVGIGKYFHDDFGAECLVDIRQSLFYFSPARETASRQNRPKTTKKADVEEYPKVFFHVGLLVNEPPGKTKPLFI